MIFGVISEQKIERKAKISSLINERIGEINDFNFSKHVIDKDNFKDFVLEVTSVSFGFERKLVLVEDAFFFSENKEKMTFLDKIDFFDLENILKNPSDDIDIVFSINSSDFKESATFSKLLKENGEIINIENNIPMIDRIRSRVKKFNCTIDDNAAKELESRLNNDLYGLVNETNKLCLYTDHITLSDINKLCAKPLEENVFALSNALLKENNIKAFSIYKDLKVKGIEPITICSMLANQFRLIYQVKYLNDSEGFTSDQIAKKLNISLGRAKAVGYNARNFSRAKLDNVLLKLADIDYKIKSGQVDRFYYFELFLINFEI